MERTQLTQDRIFGREFFLLWAPATTLSTLYWLLVHFPPAALRRQLLISIPTQSAGFLLGALIIQAAIRLALAIGIGLITAHQLGLGAPVLEACLKGEPVGRLLRRPVAPILLTVVLTLACGVLANSLMLRPNHEEDMAEATEIANSPMGAKLEKQIENLGLSASEPCTGACFAVSDLTGAIDGELWARLFKLSVIALLFVQVLGTQQGIPSRNAIWAAILSVPLLSLVSNIWTGQANNLVLSEVFGNVGLPFRADPISLVALREGIRNLAPGFALGWLYSRYGIESAITASFVAAVLWIPFLEFWVAHFRS